MDKANGVAKGHAPLANIQPIHLHVAIQIVHSIICFDDRGALLWLNAETLERAPTPSFGTLVRCSNHGRSFVWLWFMLNFCSGWIFVYYSTLMWNYKPHKIDHPWVLRMCPYAVCALHYHMQIEKIKTTKTNDPCKLLIIACCRMLIWLPRV